MVTDRPDLLARRTGPVAPVPRDGRFVAVVVEVQPGDTVPALCRSIVEIGSLGGARWRPDTSVPTRGDPVHVAGLADPVAATVAHALAAFTDPEDPSAAANGLSGAVSLGSLGPATRLGASTTRSPSPRPGTRPGPTRRPPPSSG